MNRKISVGMAVTIVILAMTVTFSITMLIAMRLFDSTVSSVKAVSYTHLDVYKRQSPRRWALRPKRSSPCPARPTAARWMPSS